MQGVPMPRSLGPAPDLAERVLPEPGDQLVARLAVGGGARLHAPVAAPGVDPGRRLQRLPAQPAQ
eukprot:481907-Lingulodinium_polyedra.AAC.1